MSQSEATSSTTHVRSPSTATRTGRFCLGLQLSNRGYHLPPTLIRSTYIFRRSWLRYPRARRQLIAPAMSTTAPCHPTTSGSPPSSTFHVSVKCCQFCYSLGRMEGAISVAFVRPSLRLSVRRVHSEQFQNPKAQTCPNLKGRFPILDTTCTPVSRSNGQKSGLDAGGGIPCRPYPAATLLV